MDANTAIPGVNASAVKPGQQRIGQMGRGIVPIPESPCQTRLKSAAAAPRSLWPYGRTGSSATLARRHADLQAPEARELAPAGARARRAGPRPDPPALLFAGHLQGDQPILVYRVENLARATAELRDRPVEIGVDFEIPHGRGVEVTNPGPQRIAVYERTRPEAEKRLAGRRDF